MKKRGKLLLLSIISIILVFGTLGCSNEENGKDIATYKGGTVTETEFNTYIKVMEYFSPQIKDLIESEETMAETRTELLNQYIAEEYLVGQAGKDKLDKKEAEETLKIIEDYWVQQLGSEEYKKMVSDLGITNDDIVDYISKYYAIGEYFVERRYNENKEEFTVATVSHILVLIDENRSEEEAKVRAEEILAKIEAGENFGELAKEYSDDPGSKDNGGTYEKMPVSIWVPEFRDAIYALPLNEVSDLVKTDYGYHIMKVIDREIPEVDDVSDEDKDRIYSEEYNKFMIDELPSIIEEINL